jgi:hypothetical protein
MAQAPLPNGAGGYQLGDGNVGEAQLSVQGAPTLLSADVTVTAAQLSNGLFTVDSAADITATLPTVALLEADVNSAKVNSSFDIAVVNVDSAYQVTFAIGTGWTIVGSAIVLEATSGQFRARKTGAGTWTLYRIA